MKYLGLTTVDAIFELIDNCFDANSNNIHITLSQNIDKSLKIIIEDDGIGIPKGEEEEIFGVFSRSSKTKNQSGGVGFGLALCREIAEAHQGHISLHNKIEGGLNVQVSLPYS